MSNLLRSCLKGWGMGGVPAVYMGQKWHDRNAEMRLCWPQ
jgi:hypothetical protein